MKLLRNFCLLLITGSAFANQTVMVDPYFSPYSGSANLIFVQDLMIQGEDAFFTKSNKDSTMKVWGRGFEQFLFWYNINMLADVTQHEVFGHGYRLRELGYHPKKYAVTPWWGATYFKDKEYYQLTVGEMLAVTVAGLEAEQILARDLKMQWMAKGEIDGRLATLYNQAQQSIFWYTWITHLGKLKGDGPDGNDVKSYMYFHNHSYPDGELTHGKLLRWTLFNWLDPMTFYSYYSFFYYIAEGKPWKFPMFSFGDDLKYLPNVKIGYAPYAPEAYLENYFLYKGNPLYFYFKGGKRSFGIGLAYDHLYSGRRGSLGFKFDGWNQGVFNTPVTVQELLDTGTAFRPSLNKRRWGAALSVTGRLNLFSKLALFSELGGKTSGYLPGYGLDREIIARIGLTFGSNSLRQKTTAEDKMNEQKLGSHNEEG
ncbi:MAG: hypothetical protein H7A41_06715 [Chlamydiales bacterium]|nr:hypothetical protein [Chlamydiales bacterium]